MSEAICKRPFARPLFCWITGTILYVCLHTSMLYLFFLLPAILWIVYGATASLSQHALHPTFRNRWTWGIGIISLFIFFAILFCELTETRLKQPNDASPGFLKEQASLSQQKLVDKINTLQLDHIHRSILSALTVGYRSEMPREVTEQFAVAGVVHILSVSGFHTAIVAACITLLLNFLPKNTISRWAKYIITLLSIWTFAYITGLSTPTVRAAVMLSLFLTGTLLKHKADSYNTLAAAAFLMLAYKPFYLLDIGFQLSFISVFALLYLQPKIAAWIPVRNPILAIPWNTISVTLAAQIGTLFLCCFYFGRISTVFLFTNLPISLLSILLIPATFIWMALPAGSLYAEILQTTVEKLTTGMFSIVDTYSHVAGAQVSIRFDLVMLLVSYTSLFTLLHYFKVKRIHYLYFTLGCILVLFVYSLFNK